MSACIVAWGQAFPCVLEMASDGAVFWELNTRRCLGSYFVCHALMYVIELCANLAMRTFMHVLFAS